MEATAPATKGFPFKRTDPLAPPLTLGADTDVILAEIGCDAAAKAALRAAKVI